MPWQTGLRSIFTDKRITDGRAYRPKKARLNIVKLFVSYGSLGKNHTFVSFALGCLETIQLSNKVTKWAF